MTPLGVARPDLPRGLEGKAQHLAALFEAYAQVNRDRGRREERQGLILLPCC